MKIKKSLKPVQLTALKLISMGTPAYRVAERLDVSVMTVYRWQRLPEFEAQLQSFANSGLEEIAKKMNATALTAVETLQETLCDLSLPPSIRIKAALGVLSAMPSVNIALENSLRHRHSDFDLDHRFDLQPITYEHGCSTSEETCTV